MLPSLRAWLDEPKSRLGCLVGWLASGALFVGTTAVLGGPNTADDLETQFTSWSIAHGQFTCSYVPHLIQEGPLYALLSAPVEWMLRIGSTAPFPTAAQMGPHCSHAIDSVNAWASQASPVNGSLLAAYLVWIPLLCGVIALLRACGRGRCGWEIATAIAVAVTPSVFMCLHEWFHPEDLLCMGLLLGGLACVRRGAWSWSGVLTGLALTSQLFGVLVLAPLLVLAPGRSRFKYAGAACGSFLAVYVPLGVATHGRILSILTGTSVTDEGFALLGQARLHGVVLVIVSRMLPIFGSMGLALWLRTRLGARSLEPVPLVALVGLSFALRLVFEVSIYGYYFMALAVSMVLLQVLEGKVRPWTVLWFEGVALAFLPPWTNLYQIHFADLEWASQIVLVPTGIAIVALTLQRYLSEQRVAVRVQALEPAPQLARV